MPFKIGNIDVTDLTQAPAYIPTFPFQVVARTNPNTQALELGVVSNSHLFNSEDKNTYEEDNSDWGLLDDDETLDTGWFPLGNIGDKIWLEIELNSGDQSIKSIDIRHDSVGTEDAWTYFPDPIEINTDDSSNPYQQFYHQIIAEITDPEQDPRPGFTVSTGTGSSAKDFQITQLLFTNIMMTTAHTTDDANEPDVPLIVAIPWNAPVTDQSGNANEINSGDDSMTPFSLGPSDNTNYDFYMFDASDSDGAKVGILDGFVYGPNDSGIVPQGMESLNDDFTMQVADGDDIYLKIHYDDGDQTADSAEIGHAGNTPDDDVDNSIRYITLGYVSVETDDSGNTKVTPRQELLGDIIIPEFPKSRDNDDDISDWTWHYDSDQDSWSWIGSLIVDDDTGNDEVDIVSKMTFTYDAIANSDAIVEQGDEYGTSNEAVVHIGINVKGDDGSEIDGNQTIEFTYDSDDSQKLVTVTGDDDQNAALVHIGVDVKGDDGTQMKGIKTIEFTYDSDSDQIVTETGDDDQNAALVHIGVDVQEVGGDQVNGVQTIIFENIDGVNDDGNNTAHVTVLPSWPNDKGPYVLSVSNGNLSWLGTTDCSKG